MSSTYYPYSVRIGLEFNVTEHSYYPRGFLSDPKYSGLSYLTDSEQISFMDGFIEYLAESMTIMLKESITDQYYIRQWAPLTQKYLEFKKAHGLKTNIWEATDRLYNSITYIKKNSKVYIVGIDPMAKYENGTPVSYVAQCMEYGTKYMPARPLFRPIINFIKRNIRTYWELYLLGFEEYNSQRLVNKINKLRKVGVWYF